MKTLLKAKIEKLAKEHGYVSTSMFTALEKRYIELMPENINARLFKRTRVFRCGKS